MPLTLMDASADAAVPLRCPGRSRPGRRATVRKDWRGRTNPRRRGHPAGSAAGCRRGRREGRVGVPRTAVATPTARRARRRRRWRRRGRSREGMSSIQPRAIARPPAASRSRRVVLCPHTTTGITSVATDRSRTVVPMSPTPQEPATTSASCATGGSPKTRRAASRSPGRNEGPTMGAADATGRPDRVRTCAAASSLGGQVQADAGSHAERVHRRVGEHGDRGDRRP